MHINIPTSPSSDKTRIVLKRKRKRMKEARASFLWPMLMILETREKERDLIGGIGIQKGRFK